MGRKWKTAIILFLALIGIISFLLKSRLLLDPVKRIILSSLTRHVPGSVEVESIGLEFFPPALTLHNVKLYRSKEDSEPVVVIPETLASFSPWSLLTEVTIVTEIRLIEPRVAWIGPGELGAAPTPDAVPDPIASVPMGKSSVVVIRSIRVINGSLDVTIPADEVRLHIPGVNLAVQPDLDMRSFRIQLKSGPGTVETRRFKKPFDTIEAALTADRKNVEIRSAQITAPDSIFRLEGSLRDFAELNYTFQMEGSVPLSDLQSFLPQPAVLSGTLHGRVNAAGGRSRPITFSGNTRVERGSMNNIPLGDARANFEYANRQVRVSDFSSSVLEGTVRGRAALDFGAEAVGYEVTADVEHLRAGLLAELAGRPGLLKRQFLDGHVAISGRGSDWGSLSGNGTLTVRAPSGSSPMDKDSLGWIAWTDQLELVSARFTVDHGKVHVEEGSARTSLSELRFDGSLDADRTLDIRFLLTSREVLDLAPLFRKDWLKGTLRMEGKATGPLDRPRILADGALTEAAVRGRRFDSVSGHFDYEHPRLTFTEAVFRSGPSLYQLKGSLSFDRSLPVRPEFEIEATISDGLPREVVALFWKELPLTVAASGPLKAAGNPQSFEVASDLVVGPGFIYGQAVDKGSLTLGVTRQDVSFENVVAEHGRTRVTGNGKITFDGRFETDVSSSENHAEDISWIKDRLPGLTSQLSGSLKGGGELKNPRFQLEAQLAELGYQGQAYGNGTLSIQVAEKQLQLVASLENGISTRFGVQFIPSYPYDLSATLTGFEAGPLLRSILPAEADWSSRVSATLSGQLVGGGTIQDFSQSTLDLQLTDVRIQVGDFSLINDEDVEVAMKDRTVEFHSLVLTGADFRAAASGSLRPGESYDLLIAANGDLDLLRGFSDEITLARGPAEASVQVQGRWEDPVFRGQVTVREGRIRSKTLDQFILVDAMDLSFSRNQIILETFEGKIGGGRILAAGKWEMEGVSAREYSVNVDLEEVRLTPTPGLNAIVDGSLLYHGSPETRSLTGELAIRRAVYDRRIDWQRFAIEAIKGSREAEGTPAVAEDIHLNIRIVGKDNILVDNNLAKIPLDIDLILRGTAKHPVLLGRMEADGGVITFRNNDFKIESGAVDFIDPGRMRPILDLAATSRVRSYRIRLTLLGPIDRLELTLTSDPVLTSHEILALLTFGTTPEEVDETQMEAVAGGEALDLLTGEIQIAVEEQAKKIGIDRLQVDPLFANTKSPGAPRVTVSKRLLEDTFYVTYITTFDASGEDILQMEYIINDNMSLIGGRDELGDMGGDLKFRFEFR